jgi:hypothetical protein
LSLIDSKWPDFIMCYNRCYGQGNGGQVEFDYFTSNTRHAFATS